MAGFQNIVLGSLIATIIYRDVNIEKGPTPSYSPFDPICNRENSVLPSSMTDLFDDLINTFHQSDGRVVVIQVWW